MTISDPEVDQGKSRQHDPTFKGPVENRSCTDIICCALFLAVIVGYIILCGIALAWGNPILLYYPKDTQGNLCGYGSNSGSPNLFYFDLTQCALIANAVAQGLSCPTPQVCVAACPDYYWASNEAAAAEAANGYSADMRSKMICKPGVNATTWKNFTITDLVTQGLCAPYIIPETALAGRCIPTALLSGVENLQKAMASSNLTFTTQSNSTVTANLLSVGEQFVSNVLRAVELAKLIYQDLAVSWPFLLLGFIIAASVSLLWLLLLQISAFFMVWIVIISFCVIFGFAVFYSLSRFLSLLSSGSSWSTGSVSFTWDYFQNQMWFWVLLSGLSTLILLVVVIMILFLRTRILIAVALLRQVSAAVTSMMEVLVVPMIPFILHVALACFCLVIASYIATLGMPSPVTNSVNYTNFTGNNSSSSSSSIQASSLSITFSCNMLDQYNATTLNQFSQYCTLFQSQIRTYTIFLQLANIFMLFWLFNFITGFFQMSTSGSFASYYFARERPRDVPCCPVLQAAWRTLRYHLGTVAFGSLIIALVQFLRLMLEYIQRNCKFENDLTKFILKCCACCLYCLEKCLKFITKNAYIMCAIRGTNFCFSAKDAFFLLMRNCLRVFVLDLVTDLVLFIGKVVVVAGMGTLAYFVFSGYFTSINSWLPQLNSFLTPMIVLMVVTYVIANGFFTVYEMGVDTIFLCFLEDLEMNDGSPEKPYFMNKEMRRLLHKRNQNAVQKVTKHGSGALTPDEN